MAGLAVLEPVKGRFGNLVAEMSPRDRALFLGLIVTGYLGLLFGGAWLGRSILSDLQSRIAAKQESLTQLESMESAYMADAGKVKDIEETLRSNATQDLPSFMEKAAQKGNIAANLKGVKEKGVDTEGNLEAKTYNVEFTSLSLLQLTDVLFEIETKGYPVRIQSTHVKSVGASGQRLLNATLEVTAYRLTDAGLVPDSAPAAEGGEK